MSVQQTRAVRMSASCSTCKTRYQVSAQTVGKKLRCRKCGNQFVVRLAPQTAFNFADPPASPAKPKKRKAHWLDKTVDRAIGIMRLWFWFANIGTLLALIVCGVAVVAAPVFVLPIAIGIIVHYLIFIVWFSLICCVLKIEKNTRPETRG